MDLIVDLTLSNILILLFTFLLGGGLAAMLVRLRGISLEESEKRAQSIIHDAQAKAANMLQEMKNQHIINTKNFQEEIKNRQEHFRKLEEIINHKVEMLKKREEKTDIIKMTIQEEETKARKMKEEIIAINRETVERLVKKADTSPEQACQQLIKKAQNEVHVQKSKYIQKIEQETQEDSHRITTNILADIMQRYSQESSVEKRASNVVIPRDSKKGMLIGKMGKNIAYFESLLNVDVIFNNDDPNEITVSAFDLVQRNIAKLALESLIKERSITDEKIKAHVEAATAKTNTTIATYGKKAIQELGLEKIMNRFGMTKIDPELIKIIGRLQFRTSFGQNIMMHSIEVGVFSALMASELGVDIDTAYLSGFFHDIGKAIDQNTEESHDVLSKQILEKFGFPKDIVHAAWAHHDGEPARTPEAQIVKAADAISAGRPGARQDSLTKHLERIKGLEEIGYSFPGILKAYAISGGRELRMIVNEKEVSDEDIFNMAKKSVEQIQERLTYPGKIKVNVIRRTTSVAYLGR